MITELNPAHLSSRDIQRELNANVGEGLRPVALCMAVLYFVLGISHVYVVEPAWASAVMVSIAFGSALFLGGIALVVWRRPISPALAHPIAMLVFITSFTNSAVHIYVTNDLHQSTNFALLIVAVGCFALSTPYVLACLGLCLGIWFALTFSLQGEPDWSHFAYMLAMSTLISLLVFSVRLKMRTRLALLRHQESRQKTLLARINILQEHINRAQTEFITGENLLGAFEIILNVLIELSQSTAGLIAAWRAQDSGSGALTIVSEFGLGDRVSVDSMESAELQRRIEKALKQRITGFSFARVRTQSELSASSLSQGDIASCVIPLLHGTKPVGAVFLEGRQGGYEEDFLHFIQPLKWTCANIMSAFQALLLREQVEGALRTSEQRFRDVAEAAGEFVWEVDVEGRFIFITKRVTEITGYSVESLYGMTPFDFMSVEDGERFRAELENVQIFGRTINGFEFRIRGAAGEEIWLSVSGVSVRDSAGAISGYRGVGMDISRRKRDEHALRESQERYDLAVRGTNDGIWDWDLRAETVFYSDRVRSMLGYSEEEFGVTMADMERYIFTEDRDRLRILLAEHLERHSVFDIESRIHAKDGRQKWIRIRGEAIRGADGKPIRMAGSISDITERKWAEETLADISDQLANYALNLRHLHRLTCTPFETPDLLYADYLATGLKLLKFSTGVVSRVAENTYTIVAVSGDTPELSKGKSLPLSASYCKQVVDSLKTVTFREPSAVDHYAPDHFLRSLGFTSYMGTPVVVNGRLYGTLCFLSKQPRAGSFRSHEIEFVELMAQSLGRTIATQEMERVRRQAEEAIAATRRYELEIGSRIQETLLRGVLPDSIQGARVATMTAPSEGIDGDFFDFYTHGPYCFDVAIGDVMGKGVPAALVSAGTKSHIQRALSDLMAQESHETLPRPSQIVGLVHERVARRLIEIESFITFCYARFDLERRRMTLVDCGHTRTIHYHSNSGHCELLKGENLPLGFSLEENYTDLTVNFRDNDVFVFYSDGLTEARNPAGDLYGLERLVEVVRNGPHRNPERLVSRIRADVERFSGTPTTRDDLTCLAISVRRTREIVPTQIETLDTRSNIEELLSIRDFVRMFCQSVSTAGIPDDTYASIELAVQEAATNIIRHGYGGMRDLPLTVIAELIDDSIRVTLEHRGSHFELNQVPPPVFDGSQEGGFGLFIIRELMDEVRVETGNGNGVCMYVLTRYLEPSAQEQGV